MIGGCALTVLRFAEGINWGYSPLGDNRFLSEDIMKVIL